jgi:hypothetical protein
MANVLDVTNQMTLLVLWHGLARDKEVFPLKRAWEEIKVKCLQQEHGIPLGVRMRLVSPTWSSEKGMLLREELLSMN